MSAIAELRKATLPTASLRIHKSGCADPPIPELMMFTVSNFASERVPSPLGLPGATMVTPLEMLSWMVTWLTVRPEMLRRSMQI